MKILTLKKYEKVLSTYRQKLHAVMSECYVFISQDRLSTVLRPVRTTTERTCAISGQKIPAGEFTFPCYGNPVRLSPAGPERCSIHHAKKNFDGFLPENVEVFQLPTHDQISNIRHIKASKSQHRRMVEFEGTRLLKAANMKGR